MKITIFGLNYKNWVNDINLHLGNNNGNYFYLRYLLGAQIIDYITIWISFHTPISCTLISPFNSQTIGDITKVSFLKKDRGGLGWPRGIEISRKRHSHTQSTLNFDTYLYLSLILTDSLGNSIRALHYLIQRDSTALQSSKPVIAVTMATSRQGTSVVRHLSKNGIFQIQW